ncbi:unnamed protein product, partial [Adineta ricciae]
SQSDQPNPPQTTNSQSETRCDYCRRKWKKILFTSLATALMMTICVIVSIIMAKKHSDLLVTVARRTTTTSVTTTSVTTTTAPTKGLNIYSFCPHVL